MTLINLTPHPIRIYSPETPDRIDDIAAGLIGEIQPEGPPARIATVERGNSGYECDEEAGLTIPLELVEYGHVRGLPPQSPGVRLIVPLVVALALPRRSDLRVPHGQVRNTDGAVIGCRLLAQVC